MDAFAENGYREPPRYEILGSKKIMMSPSPTVNHNRIVQRVYRIFDNYLRNKKCEVFSDSLDVYFNGFDIAQPDIKVVCNKDIIKEKRIEGAPDLIVEVLSPGTAARDKSCKKDLYERHGVKEYWIIDPLSYMIEQYILRENKYVLNGVYMLYPDYELEDMTEDEIKAIPMEFKTSLFDDLTICIKDIFENII